MEICYQPIGYIYTPFQEVKGMPIQPPGGVGVTGRIEVEPEGFQKLMNGAVRNAMITFFKTLGFDHVVLDLEGYRTGSLNMTIPSIKEKGIDGS